jgi:hypothetical protein
MKFLLSLCAVVLAAASFNLACAAETDSDASDIVILSVKPRSPEVKPIAMSVSASGHETVVTEQRGDKVQRVASSTDTSTRR